MTAQRPVHQEIKTLCDEILAERPDDIQLQRWEVDSSVDPKQVYETIASSSLGDMLLPQGKNLSAEPQNEYQPNIKLSSGVANLGGVSVWAWELNYNVDGSICMPHSGETPTHWSRKLDIRFHYGNKGNRAVEVLALNADSTDQESLPEVSRHVLASQYADMGYSGHLEKVRSCQNPEEVDVFLSASRQVLAERLEYWTDRERDR